MVAILGANSVSGGYEIDNSLRFNDNDSAKLGLAFGSGGNTKTWTASCWFKRGIISSRQSFLNVGSSGSEYMSLYIDSDDKLYWVTESGGNLYRIGSSALFRDPSAWYHIVFRQDTTDGTANNRFRYYINGAEVDTGAFNAQPTQNFDGKIGGNDTHYIGSNRDGDGEFMDGYLTEYHYLDGISYDPTYFGEFDDNGVWIPKKYTGSYGTKGFYLEFKQTGTSANSSGIGADTSGNDNHWTPTNLAATDITTDTCTNNFATMNPLSNDAGGLTMSEGNLSMTCTTTRKNIKASFALPDSGKWYWEWKFNEATGDSAIMNPSIAPVTSISDSSLEGSGIFAFWVYTADILYVKYNNSAARTNQNISFGTDDTMQFAVDMNTRRVYLGKNNTWYNTGTGTDGDPAAGTGYLATLSSTLEYAPSYAGETTSKTANVNFGQKAFAYTPPSGFFALNSTNLAKYG